MKNNIVHFVEKVSSSMHIKLTCKAYKKLNSINILDQIGNLFYSKLNQTLSINIFQNILKNNTFNNSRESVLGLRKLYKSIVLRDDRYANALVCIARALESDNDLDDVQTYGIIDALASLGDVCVTGQRRGIIKIVYMLAGKIEKVTNGEVKIQEDEDILKRTIDKLFLEGRIRVANKLMDEFYIKQRRRNFTDPHMEKYFKKYLNDRYDFNIPVLPEVDPYGINIEGKDLKNFLKNINLEDVLIRELFEDIRIECEGNAEFYYAIVDWAENYLYKKKYTDDVSEFLCQNIFYGESKKIRYTAIHDILKNEGYIIDISTISNELKNCVNVYEQIDILKKYKDILYVKYNGITLQEYLFASNDVETLRILHKHKCIQIHTRDRKGESLLIKACRHGQIEMILFLLDIGVSIEDKARNGDTALMIACEENRIDIVKILVERGANVNARGRCAQTALMYACEFKSKDIVEYLIKHGAEVNAKTNHGSTALIYTFLTYAKNDENNLKITKLLLENGAYVNARGEYGTALIYAVKYWSREVVKVLLSYGANVNDTDNKGESVLKLANRRKDKGVLEVLSKHIATTKLCTCTQRRVFGIE